MPATVSAGQSLRITAKAQDFQARVFTGPKRSLVQIASVQNGLGSSPTYSTTLTQALSPTSLPAGALVVSTAGFANSGTIWIGGQLFQYASKTLTSFQALQPTDQNFSTLAIGTSVSQWYDISDKVSGISVSGQLDEYSGAYTASLRGMLFDSRVIDSDLAVLIQINVYPDYPSLRVGAPAGGAWPPGAVDAATVGWSGWRDFFFGYIVSGSVTRDYQSNTWSFSVEGTGQYLKRSDAPAKSFGRKNLALNKSTKTSSSLQSLVWERVGTPGSEGEYIGSPDVSGKAAVDDDMSSLWVSDGFPSASAVGEFTENGEYAYPKIEGFCTRSPWPGIADKYAQWVAFYNPGDTESNFLKKRYDQSGYYYQRMGLAVPKTLTNDGRSNYDVLDLTSFGVRIAANKRLVFCYSKGYFHRIFGQLPDITVVEWGLLRPDWVLNPTKDLLLVIDVGEKNGNGRYIWPLGWGGGNSTESDAVGVEGVAWGYSVGRPVLPFKHPNAGTTHYFIPKQSIAPLNAGSYGQRAVSGNPDSGFITTQRTVVTQGTRRRAEWLTVDLGEFFTKLESSYAAGSEGTTIRVEATEGFAATGYLQIDLNLYSYSSKSDNSFKGVQRVQGSNTVTHASGTLVYQTDSSGRLINMPLIGAIQFKRPLGKSLPNRGEIRVSDHPEPTDPLTDPQYAGWDWTQMWSVASWRFNQTSQNFANPNMTTFEVTLNPPRRARHVAFFIEGMTGGNRAKLNEVAIYEPVASTGDESIPTDENGRADTGAVVKYYLLSKFGMAADELSISPGVTFASLDIAQGDYWSVLTQLAAKTEHIIVNDQYNKILYKPHPLFGMGTEQPPVFYSWTDETMENVDLSLLQTNRVGQVILRAKDSTIQQAYTVEYPDSPSILGSKKTIDDTMIFGSGNIIQKAQKHFKYENRLRSIKWSTGIADEVEIGQRHVVTASVDAANLKLSAVNFFVTGVQFELSFDSGKKSWTTQISAEEYVLQ